MWVFTVSVQLLSLPAFCSAQKNQVGQLWLTSTFEGKLCVEIQMARDPKDKLQFDSGVRSCYVVRVG